jgi:endonuclease-3
MARTAAAEKRRIAEIFDRFAAAKPEPRTELAYATPFTLLAAVVLSAQATDVSVNKATARLYAVADTPAEIERHGGEVPLNREALQALPGVGRKTASVVLNEWEVEPAVAVDTHVFRVAHRLGLAKGKTPDQVEVELMKVVPPARLTRAHHWLILHGRYVCLARRPKCRECLVADLCPSRELFEGG